MIKIKIQLKIYLYYNLVQAPAFPLKATLI